MNRHADSDFYRLNERHEPAVDVRDAGVSDSGNFHALPRCQMNHAVTVIFCNLLDEIEMFCFQTPARDPDSERGFTPRLGNPESVFNDFLSVNVQLRHVPLLNQRA